MADRTRKSGKSNPWRDVLLRHAEAVYAEAFNGGGPNAGPVSLAPDLRASLDDCLGPIATEAVQIVEDFAIGAAANALNGAAENQPGGSDLSGRLAIILDGLEPRQDSGKRAHVRPQVIQSGLWELLHLTRESAELSYAREFDLVDLDRRILLLINQEGAMVPAEISGTMGVDKAQVSRSVKRLLELRMVEREQIRAPVALTHKGKQLSDRLRKLAELRNRELTFEIPDDELKRFVSVVEKLLGRAVVLYEQERENSNSVEADREISFNRPLEERSPEGKITLSRRQIISPLMTLSAYFSRSGALTFKRLTKLSNFEAWVLNEIGMAAPIEWSDLVSRLNRDHSQAGRTINTLIEKEVVEREGKPGRRHGRFAPTRKGWELWETIQQAGRERNAFLMAPLSRPEREGFLATFDKIRRNALAQLERERAYVEFDQG